MSIIDRLDNYYSSRKSSEVWLMVILFSVLIGYLLYTLLSPITSEYREQEESRYNTLQTSIDSSNSFLKSITVNGDRDYYVKDLSKKVINKRVELNGIRQKLAKLDSAVKSLSEFQYNKDNWSKFLDNIAKKAKDNDLKVYNISNVAYDQNSSFGKVLDVSIKCQGDYAKLLSFMNSLEKSQLVSNVSHAKIKAAPNYPIADINLTIWGIRP
jgi:hypothetical protein